MTRSGKAFIAAAALIMLVGACGSSSSKGTGGNNLIPGSNSNSGSNSSKSGSSSGNSSLDSLIAKGKTADIKVTYKTSSGGDNETFILAQRGKDSVFNYGDIAVYNVGGKAITCTNMKSSPSCIDSGTSSASANPVGSIFTTYSTLLQNSALNPYLKSLKQSSETIAGRDAKCLTLSGSVAAAAGGSGTICIDAKNGILLKIQGTDTSGGSTTSTLFEATSVGTPSDSDFKLPATPTTVTTP